MECLEFGRRSTQIRADSENEKDCLSFAFHSVDPRSSAAKSPDAFVCLFVYLAGLSSNAPL